MLSHNYPSKQKRPFIVVSVKVATVLYGFYYKKLLTIRSPVIIRPNRKDSYSSKRKSCLLGNFYQELSRPQARKLGMRLAFARLLPSFTTIQESISNSQNVFWTFNIFVEPVSPIFRPAVRINNSPFSANPFSNTISFASLNISSVEAGFSIT